MSEGDSFTRSGVVRHACRHRVTATSGEMARGVFVLGDSFAHTELGNDTDDTEGRGAVAVCSEDGCDSKR